MKKLGPADYDNLLKGKLSWSDPRVVDTLRQVRAWTEAGLLPTTFTTLKLGEAHTYFHTNPGAVLFLNGSWYTSRAFNPPDKGGQPANFPLGVMKFPSIAGAACNECRTMSVQRKLRRQCRDQASEGSDRLPELVRAARCRQSLARERARADGDQGGLRQGRRVRTPPTSRSSAQRAGRQVLLRAPIQVMDGKPKEVFTQVFNNAFPAGSISVEDAVKQMNAAYGK